MPKVEIDYSNTIFYKIFCKDPAIKDLYVGLTTNFVQRKHAHKQSCKNEKALNHNCKLYNAIRNAGGWDNWQMEIIAFNNCADSYEARKKEQEYFEALGATLNSIDPFPKPKIKEHSVKIVKDKKILFCEPCNAHFSHWTIQETHNNTKKHNKMAEIHDPTNPASNGTEIKPKLSPEYCCKCCHYTTRKKSNIDNHYRSAKHIKSMAITEINPKLSSRYICLTCHKEYKDNSGLWRHRNKGSCENPTGGKLTDAESEFVDIHDKHIDLADKDGLIIMLIKQNAELIKEQGSIKQMMMEQQNKIIEQQNFVLEIAKKWHS